jgi:hypothetical protein
VLPTSARPRRAKEDELDDDADVGDKRNAENAAPPLPPDDDSDKGGQSPPVHGEDGDMLAQRKRALLLTASADEEEADDDIAGGALLGEDDKPADEDAAGRSAPPPKAAPLDKDGDTRVAGNDPPPHASTGDGESVTKRAVATGAVATELKGSTAVAAKGAQLKAGAKPSAAGKIKAAKTGAVLTAKASPLPEGWVEYMAVVKGETVPYYVFSETKEVVWDRPPAVPRLITDAASAPSVLRDASILKRAPNAVVGDIEQASPKRPKQVVGPVSGELIGGLATQGSFYDNPLVAQAIVAARPVQSDGVDESE